MVCPHNATSPLRYVMFLVSRGITARSLTKCSQSTAMFQGGQYMAVARANEKHDSDGRGGMADCRGGFVQKRCTVMDRAR